MSKLIGLTVLLFLTACSQSNSPVSQNPKENEIINLEAKSMAITGALDFGNMLPTDTSKLVSFTLKNNGTEALTGPATISGSDFYLAYQNCTTVAVGKSCSVKVSFNPKGKSGPYTSTLTLDSVSGTLTASVTPPTPPTLSVQYLSSSVDISSTGLDFGTITDKQSLIKTISIKNDGQAVISAPSVVLGASSPYTISYDACSGKDLAKGSSCSIKVSLNGSGKSGSQSSSLTFAGKILALSGQVTATSSSGSGSSGGSGSVVLEYFNGTTNLQGAYNYGTLSGTQSSILIATIKNTGTLAFSGGPVSLSSADFSIVYNSCNNKPLAIGASCSVRVSFSASGKANNTYSGTLSLGGAVLNLSGVVQTISAVITYAPQYSSYGSCSAQVCDGSGVQSRSIISCRKLSDGVDIGSATLSNCSSFNVPSNLQQACQSPAGNKTIAIDNGSKEVSCDAGSNVQNLVSLTCSSDFHEQSGACVADIISFEPSYSAFGACSAQACDGTGTESRTLESCQKISNGTPVAGGQLSDCSAYNTAGYLDQPCFSPAGNKTIAIANGSKEVSCLLGSSVENFISISCNDSSLSSGYHSEDNNSCISNSRSCVSLPEGAASGTEVFASGSWGSCSVASCSSGYDLSGGNCVAQGGGNTSSQVAIRPNNITVSDGHIVEFFARGYSSSASLSISFIGLSGASVTEGPSSMLMLGDYVHKFKVSFAGVAPSVGKVRVSDGTLISESNITVSDTNFGIGGLASNGLLKTWVSNYIMPSVAISGSGANKKYYIETSELNNIQTMGLTGWNSKGVIIADNHARVFGEVGWGSPRVDSQGRVYTIGYACGQEPTQACNRYLSNGLYFQDGNVVIKRYDASGQLDTSFDGDGFKIVREPDENLTTIGYNSDPTSFDIIDDKLVIGTNSNLRISNFGGNQRITAMYVLNLDGSYDTSFNGTGYKVLDYKECVITQVNPIPDPCVVSIVSRVTKIAKRDNSYYAIASVQNKPSSVGTYSLGIIKMSLTGVLDSSYGDNGVAINFLSNNETYNSQSAFVSDDGYVFLHYTAYGVSYQDPHYYIISKFNLSDASRVTNFGSGGKVYPIESVNGLGTAGGNPVYFFGAFTPISNGESIFGVGTTQPMLEADLTYNLNIEKTLLFKLNQTGQITVFHDMNGYMGLRTFSLQQDGGELIAYGLQNVRSQNIPSKISGQNDPGGDIVLTPQLGSTFGIYKVDLSFNSWAPSILESKQKQQEHLKYSSFCGPYGDYDVVTNQCVCDSGYDLYHTQNSLPYTSYLCVKLNQELCSSQSNYNSGTMLCEGTSTCNYNGMCESWMGEDSMSCSSDCGGMGAYCGNGMCETWMGEDSMNCSMDCGSMAYCGDGMCNNGEDQYSCSNDCGSPPPMCGSYSDESSCNMNGCSWSQNYSDCSYLGDSATCSMNGCMWFPNQIDCNTFSDEGTCIMNSGCSWDGGMNSCLGTTQDPYIGSCGGGSYPIPGSGSCY